MKLAYRAFGSGKPLIILHGLFGQSDNWNTLAKQFAESGFQVFTIDQRNHGLSDHSTEWDYECMANDLREFIDTHQLKNPILLGHSMGGKTVLFFEWMFPKYAEQLIVVDIATRAYTPHHNEVLNALNAVNFDEVKSRKDAEVILGEYIPDFGTKQFLLKNIYWKSTEENKLDWRFNLKVIGDNYNNIGVMVPEFNSTVPCLVISGEKSDYVNLNDQEDFKKRFSSIQFLSVPGAGHWVHAEKPKEFFEAVIRFIK
ncbi:MAG: alpha/beta fold hydrolase [Sphingobacteriaceae bacterium]|nr:alpha/beta fold hydrolase [Sphingobacteriaceae bacterium]